MQVFEIFELEEYPYMEAREISEGIFIKDIIPEKSQNKVFLIVDHVGKKVWTYYGPESSIKIQVYGVLLANKMREQMKLFYKVDSLNRYTLDNSFFLELIHTKIGTGKAKSIKKEDFGDLSQLKTNPPYITIFWDINSKKVIESVYELAYPTNLIRKFLIIGGTIYAEEEVLEKFLEEEKVIKKPEKLGRLNNGFTFFNDQAYSTRLLIKDRKIEAIELFVSEEEKQSSLELEIPIIGEEKYTREGDFDTLEEAFQIPPPDFSDEEIKRMDLHDKLKTSEEKDEE